MDIIRNFSRFNSCARVFLLSMLSLLNLFSLSIVSAQYHVVSAEYHEDVQAALELYNQVGQFLEKKLNRLNAPASYRNSYAHFKAKEFEIKKLLSENPSTAANIIHSSLSFTRMSHLRFKKLKKGSLGIEFSKCDGARVDNVYPNSPAEKCGIKVGDYLVQIAGKPFPEIDLSSLLEDSAYSNTTVFLKNGKLISLKALPEESFKQGSFGFFTKINQDDTCKITRVFPDSHAARLGLKKGDTILAVDDALCDEIKLKFPGQEVTIRVKKSSGLESPFKLTVSSGTAWDQTYFKEVLHQGQKDIYVRIADFGEKYSPEVIHEALKAAKNQFIIIDLRGNPGGRCEHLLSYFLKPEVPIVSFIGLEACEKAVIKLIDFLNGNACWKSQVKEDPLPFFGRVAFLVDEDTCCAAEMCVLAPIEYQSLRKNKENNGIKYNGELYPRKIIVIGKTSGKAQWLQEERFTNRLGQFVLDYPGADLYINNQSIEGNGIDGMPVRDSIDSDGMDPEIIQAIEWNEKQKLKPPKFEMVDF